MKAGETLNGIIMNVEENSLDLIDIYKENQEQRKQIEKLTLYILQLEKRISGLENK